MKRSGIRRTLFLSHVGVALASLLIVTILVNAAVYFSFGGYIRSQQKAEARAIAQELGEAYSESEGWPVPVLMSVSHRVMLRNFALRVTGPDGDVIWDPAGMNIHMPGMAPAKEAAADDSHMKKAYQAEITRNGAVIGTLWLGSAGGYYQERERSFLIRVNGWIWLTLMAVMAGVYAYSRSLSSRISKPLLEIKSAANRMTEGDLEARVAPDSGEQEEIAQVGEALNHLAERLFKQEQLRKTLTADIAHELRTPVATVRSYIEAFQDGVWEPTPDKLDICHVQIMQLIHLIQDLEKLAEAENPMLELLKEKLELTSVIHEAERTVRELAGAKRIAYHPPENREAVLSGDYRRLLQVFVNLLGNAFKYTQDGGRVEVRIEEEAETVTVRITDTGPGIRPEELPYIFERFYRGERSRNRKLGGAGIGLAVVKALVEAHGGTVAAVSEPNRGSEFVVRLPRG